MRHLINKQVSDIEISGIRKILNRIQKSPDIINLTFGQPDFKTPHYIKVDGLKAIEEDHTAYTVNAGLLELRKAASTYMKDLYRLEYNPEDEIIVTTGASEALDIAFRTILSEDSEVILPAPIYSGYEPLIRLCRAKPIFIDTTETDFKITASLIEEHITENTRCIMMPYPSNPLGVVLSEKEIAEIGELLKDKNIFVVSDEIYSELTYDGIHHTSIATIPEIREKTIVINGLSKSHAMTGWRIGFTFAPAYLTDEMLKIHSFTAVCANSIGQQAAIKALSEGTHTEEILSMKAEYEKRKSFVYERLIGMGLNVIEPKGAFYIFPSIKNTDLTSIEFVNRLIDEQKVAVIPGNSFSDLGEGFIRISFAQSMEDLEEALNRIETFLASLKVT